MGSMSREKSVGHDARPAPICPGRPHNCTISWRPPGRINVMRAPIKFKSCITPLIGALALMASGVGDAPTAIPVSPDQLSHMFEFSFVVLPLFFLQNHSPVLMASAVLAFEKRTVSSILIAGSLRSCIPHRLRVEYRKLICASRYAHSYRLGTDLWR